MTRTNRGVANPGSWDQRYAVDDYLYGTRANDFLREHVTRIPDGAVLCLGDGEGRNSVFLAEQGYAVTAIDQSSVGLAKCEALAQKRGVTVTTVCMDLADYRIEVDAWQGVVSMFCHTDATTRAALHGQLFGGLKTGGILLLEAYTPDQLGLGTGGPPVAGLMMELAVLREELQGLDFELARELRRDIQEGQLHRGEGAVVQVIACRST